MIKKSNPKVCGINFGYHSLWISEAQAAACADQVKAGARSMRESLHLSGEVRRAEVAHLLTDTLKQESPQLDKLGQELARVMTKSESSLDEKLKAINLKAGVNGVKFDVRMGGLICTGSKEICTKILSLAYVYVPYDKNFNMMGNTERLSQYYKTSDNPEISKAVYNYENITKEADDIIRQADKGLIVTEDKLAEKMAKAKTLIHPSAASSFEHSSQYIRTLIPQNKSLASIAESAGAFSKKGAEWLAKNGKALGKKLPLGIGALIGVATGANAAESTYNVATNFVPGSAVIEASIGSTGCAEVDSRFAPRSNIEGKCQAAKGLNDGMINFLTLPADKQAEEVCRFPYLAGVIDELSRSQFPRGLKLVCGSNEYTTSQVGGGSASAYGKYFFTPGGSLQRASVMRPMDEGVSAYDIAFGADGNVAGGTIRSSRSTVNIKPGASDDKSIAVASTLPAQQVLAQGARTCCTQNNAAACGMFSAISGQGNAVPSNSGASDNAL
jgi:hypothetical protein